MSGDRIFITTGKPNSSAAATAASALSHACSGADWMPAAASRRFASASLGVARGQRDRRHDRRSGARRCGERGAEAAHRGDRRHRARRILVHAPAVGFQFGAAFVGGVITDSA